jgi:hypothetical protein
VVAAGSISVTYGDFMSRKKARAKPIMVSQKKHAVVL